MVGIKAIKRSNIRVCAGDRMCGAHCTRLSFQPQKWEKTCGGGTRPMDLPSLWVFGRSEPKQGQKSVRCPVQKEVSS